MSFIILEGIDRSGKSTVAELYKNKGFEIVHMNAPDKKYFQPGYSGPSYLEDMVDMYNIYSGKDVLFDRSIYGECIWPHVYDRISLLNTEDIEYLKKIEYNNNTEKFLLFDKNLEAHWQRCVDNNEPINRMQFTKAMRLYDELARDHNFKRKQITDFNISPSKFSNDKDLDKNINPTRDLQQDKKSSDFELCSPNTLDQRLERANAIRSLLKSSLVKKKGEVFKELESNIKGFLEKELENIFSEPKKDNFTQDEVQILKIYAQRIREKMK